MTAKLSPAQLDALAWARSHAGYVTIGSGRPCPVARNTAKSLVALGLLKFVGSTEWRHGIGNTVQYKVTELGRATILIGSMLTVHS